MDQNTIITTATRTSRRRPIACALSAAALAGATASPSAAQFGGFLNMQNYTTASISGQSAPVIGDFNGDGVLDAAIVSMNYHTLMIMLGDGAGGFALGSAPAAAGFPSGVEAGDFNGDGVLDLAVLCSGQAPQVGVVRIYQGLGDGGFIEVAATPVGYATVALAVADFDLDGRLDLAVTDDATDTFGITPDIVTIYPGLGGYQFGPGRQYVTPPMPYNVLAHDVNMDGYADLVIPSSDFGRSFSDPGLVAILTNNGAGEFVQTACYNVGAFPVDMSIGDVNADGAPDFLAVSEITGDISMIRSDGQGGYLPETRIAPSPVASNLTAKFEAISLGDIDGDGDLDLVMATRIFGVSLPTTYKIEVRRGNGDGSFDHLISYSAAQRLSAIELFDVNGDSSPDFFGVYLGAGAGVMTNMTPMRAPLPFDLLLPGDGAVGVPVPGESNVWPGTVAALEWEDAAAFHHTYTVRVAKDPELNDLVFETTGLTESRHLIPAGALKPGTTYYWSVTATNPTGSTAADPGVFRFTTATPADLNGDGAVNGVDLLRLLSAWTIPN